MPKYIAQRLLGSSGDWYDIPANGHQWGTLPDRAEFLSPGLARENAVTMFAENQIGVVPKIRVVMVMEEFDPSQEVAR